METTTFLSVILHTWVLLVSPLSATIAKRPQQRCLQEARGSVAEGDYSYFTVALEGPLAILLRSTSGDADLYVSSYDLIPTWQPHSYSLQSSTCGDDVVFVPAELRRPLHVAVYGHPSHASSDFTLRVFCSRQTPDGPALEEDDATAKSAAVCRPESSCGCFRRHGRESREVFAGARDAGLEWLGPSIIWMPIVDLLSLFLLIARRSHSSLLRGHTSPSHVSENEIDLRRRFSE